MKESNEKVRIRNKDNRKSGNSTKLLFPFRWYLSVHEYFSLFSLNAKINIEWMYDGVCVMCMCVCVCTAFWRSCYGTIGSYAKRNSNCNAFSRYLVQLLMLLIKCTWIIRMTTLEIRHWNDASLQNTFCVYCWCAVLTYKNTYIFLFLIDYYYVSRSIGKKLFIT